MQPAILVNADSMTHSSLSSVILGSKLICFTNLHCLRVTGMLQVTVCVSKLSRQYIRPGIVGELRGDWHQSVNTHYSYVYLFDHQVLRALRFCSSMSERLSATFIGSTT